MFWKVRRSNLRNQLAADLMFAALGIYCVIVGLSDVNPVLIGIGVVLVLIFAWAASSTYRELKRHNTKQ